MTNLKTFKTDINSYEYYKRRLIGQISLTAKTIEMIVFSTIPKQFWEYIRLDYSSPV